MIKCSYHEIRNARSSTDGREDDNEALGASIRKLCERSRRGASIVILVELVPRLTISRLTKS
ncbi:unnamed protein product [Fusarium graminearum]|nr:unnamed protein product [Fusarium graminearum]CAG1981728.1 unnamed protein product [Fusarium graminearum]VTO90822.1 unnamed protein product [Fusarium graminearum]